MRGSVAGWVMHPSTSVSIGRDSLGSQEIVRVRVASMSDLTVTPTEVVLDMPDGSVDAVVVRPSDADADHRYPPVLLIMDAIGLRARLVEMAERIASWGYVVLVPNVYYRQGSQPLIPLDAEPEAFWARMKELMAAYTPEMWAQDGPAYLDVLAGRDDTTDEPVRVTGYCMGGVLGLRLAAQCPDRVATVAGFHTGGLVTDAPDSAHLAMRSVTASLYYLYADNDASMPLEAQRIVAEAAAAAGVDYTAEVAEGAAHGYTMADRPAHHPVAEARHWAVLRARFSAV